MRPAKTAVPRSDLFGAVDRRRRQVRAEAARLGVSIVPRGKGFHLLGPGVDMLVVDLAVVQLFELAPYHAIRA